MKRKKRLALFSLLVVFLLPVPCARAQAASPAANQDLLDRVRQLESQLEQMRAELAALRKALGPTESGSAAVASQQAVASPPARLSEQVKAERSLPGLELGPWRVVPFGIVYFNAFSNSSGTNNTDVPLFAQPGPGNLSVSGRQSRLGLRLEGPNLAGAKLSGLVEADFFGGFPAIGVGETFGVVRLRLAYARLDWKSTSLLAGQDWQVLAPNNPVSIASAAIPDITAAGNLWMRLPQLRVETRGGSKVKWLGQAAVLMPGTGDFPPGTTSPFLLQPGAGARARLPVRTIGSAWAVRQCWERPCTTAGPAWAPPQATANQTPSPRRSIGASRCYRTARSPARPFSGATSPAFRAASSRGSTPISPSAPIPCWFREGRAPSAPVAAGRNSASLRPASSG